MLSVLAIDLAERYSAAVGLAMEETKNGPLPLVFHESSMDAGESTHSVGARLKGLKTWCEDLADVALAMSCVVLFEDAHLHAINPKPVMRAQGVLLLAFYERDIVPFPVTAGKWQRGLGYKPYHFDKRQTTKGWAKEKALDLDYAPDVHGKALEDLRDAFLMAYWYGATPQLSLPESLRIDV